MVLLADDRARRTSAVNKCPLDVQRRIRAQRNLVAGLAYVLESRLINDRRADDLGVADLYCLFGAVRVVSNRRERKLSNAFIVLVVPHVLIADRQYVTGSELEIEARADVEHCRWTWDRLVIRNDVVRWTEDLSGDHRFVVNVSLLNGEEVRSLLAERTADVPIEDLGVIARLFCHERIERVEGRRVAIHHNLAVYLVCSRFGKDLDPSVTELVVLCGEGILVDTNFPDGRLGRELSGGKSVNIN